MESSKDKNIKAYFRRTAGKLKQVVCEPKRKSQNRLGDEPNKHSLGSPEETPWFLGLDSTLEERASLVSVNNRYSALLETSEEPEMPQPPQVEVVERPLFPTKSVTIKAPEQKVSFGFDCTITVDKDNHIVVVPDIKEEPNVLPVPYKAVELVQAPTECVANSPVSVVSAPAEEPAKKVADTCSVGVGVAEVVDEWEEFKIPKRSTVNKIVKNKKSFVVYKKLLYHLRCKFHLKYRDHHHMNTLVNEARLWLIKNEHSCDNEQDFAILASAVQVAFLVCEEELEFRQTIKDRTNWDNMVHLNKTVTGNLGKMHGIPEDHSFIGRRLSDLRLSPKRLEI